MPILTEKLASHHDSIIEFIKKNVVNISGDNAIHNNDANFGEVKMEDGDEIQYVPELQRGCKMSNPIYCYNSKFWDVPKNWTFQKNPTRKIGWEYWLKGKPGNEVIQNGVKKLAPIKPFRKFILQRLPKKEQNVFSSSWKPIFSMMEEAPEFKTELKIPKDPKEITTKFIDESFEVATKYLQQRVSYIFGLNFPKISVGTPFRSELGIVRTSVLNSEKLRIV
jgi:hypothetical protein